MLRRTVVASIALLSACATTPRGPTTKPVLLLKAETLQHEPALVGGAGGIRIVDVWATWCGPCRAASKRLEAFLGRHPEVEEVALSVDDSAAPVEAFLKDHPSRAKQFHYPGGYNAARSAGLRGVPLFVVLDRRGRVVSVITGLGEDLERRLADAMVDAEEER